MKTRVIRTIYGLAILAIVMLFGVSPVKATSWTSGHHEIVDGDVYGEIWMYNDASADMFGGDVFKLETFDTSCFDLFDGELDLLYAHGNSFANVHAGILGALGCTESSLVNLHAYDVVYHPTGGHFDRGWVEGKYLDNDLYFHFDLDDIGTFSHINVVPEPTTLLLLGLSCLFLRRRN